MSRPAGSTGDIICIDPGHQSRGNNGKEPEGPGSQTMKTKVAGGTGGVVSGVPEYQLTLTIGMMLKTELQNRGYEVIIIDNLSNSSADVVDNIEKVSGIRPAFEKLDCLDFAGLDAVFAKYKGIKAIIHFAASKAVGESVEKPLLCLLRNE